MRLRILPAIAVLATLSLGVGAYAVSRPPAEGTGGPTSGTLLARAHNSKAAKSRAATRRDPAAALERTLRRNAAEHFVLVATFYSRASELDHLAVLEARAGATESRAGFVAMDVTRNRAAAQLASRYGLRDVPAVLVVRRSTKRTMKMAGYIDRAAIAQAVDNARSWRF